MLGKDEKRELPILKDIILHLHFTYSSDYFELCTNVVIFGIFSDMILISALPSPK
jgi:hypothetical protein